MERQLCNDDHLNLGKLNKWQIPVLFGDYLMTMMALTFKKFLPESKMTHGRDYEMLPVARSCNLGFFYIFCSNSKKVTITGQLQG